MIFPPDVANSGLCNFAWQARMLDSTLLCFGIACLGISSASARTLDDIIASHHFSICASQDELPFSAKSAANPGFYLDIARKISDSLGVDLKVDWIPTREQIRYTQCDAVMGAVAGDEASNLAGIDKKAIKARILTIPYMTVPTLLVLPNRRHDIHSMDDLKSLNVAVASGSVMHKLLNDNGIPVWVRFRNDAEIIDAVESGQADAGVVSQPGFGWYRQNNPHTGLIGFANVFGDPARPFKVAIGLRRTNVETVSRINEILGKMMADGGIAEILGRYGIQFVAP
jgi:polar amino acid transport system substrate-binding protein